MPSDMSTQAHSTRRFVRFIYHAFSGELAQSLAWSFKFTIFFIHPLWTSSSLHQTSTSLNSVSVRGKHCICPAAYAGECLRCSICQDLCILAEWPIEMKTIDFDFLRRRSTPSPRTKWIPRCTYHRIQSGLAVDVLAYKPTLLRGLNAIRNMWGVWIEINECLESMRLPAGQSKCSLYDDDDGM